MNLIIWVYLALGIWRNVSAIYYLDKKEVFRPPTNRSLRNDSYFGYSITYDALKKTLVISAPRENDIGEVYTCSIENRVCTPINQHNIVQRISSNYTHDYWFGATVKAGRDYVMICAPRYTVLFAPNGSAGTSIHATNGRCYSYTALRGLEERRPILEMDRVLGFGDSYNLENAMDSFGWSIGVTSKNYAIVGGPGMYHGRAMIYKGTDKTKVPELFATKKNNTDYNFGYAVASGMFINTGESYAVSSTHGSKGKGMIVFYKDTNITKYIEDPSHIGSMFGAVLCAARLLGDRTDLLVGAPAFATKNTYNLGAVYVYLARRIGKVPYLHRRIEGKVSGSMFGSAIINVGDLNGDDRDELAISAPFEKNGHGVVYLYSGADLANTDIERELKYLQRIEAEESYGESFGMSISPLLDYDENGCKELAIGSPYKDTVVLLRCMAAVTVETLNPKLYNLQIRNSSQIKFDFEVCLTVTYPTLPKKIIAVLSTTVEIMHAKLLNGTAVFINEISLDKKKPKHCNNISLLLPEDGIYESKVSYTITSKLQNNPTTLPDFDSSRVILSDRSLLTKQGSVWADECEDCVLEWTLTYDISFHHVNKTYVIGSSKTESVSMSMHNTGAVAYEPCVRMHIIGVNVLSNPSGCVHEDLADQNRLVCKPPMPIRTDGYWTTGEVVLEMTHLTNLDREDKITINMFFFDRCEDVPSENVSITVPVKADPQGISAKGETDRSSIVNMTKEDMEKNGKIMQHIYTITNKGPTNWKDLNVLVNLETKLYIKYSPVVIHYSSSNSNYGCTFLRQNETIMSYVCLIESLVKNLDIVKILIPMYIVPGTLDGILEKDKNVTITSSVKLKLIGDDSKVESTITTITFQEPIKVPIETIIIGVVVGLCILIIIALILFKVGFLRRKKRRELEILKMEMKRQIILNRSTKPSQAEDQTEILEGIQEENENGHTQNLKET